MEKARTTTLPRVLYSLGIENVGLANAKLLCREFHNDLRELTGATKEQLSCVDGIGDVIAGTIRSWFCDEKNMENFCHLLSELTIEGGEENGQEQILKGKTFVITGSVNYFKNRNELKAKIESLGGKATGSVTSKTDYLINNDTQSSSSKNRKARELSIPVISEEEFLNLIGEPVG